MNRRDFLKALGLGLVALVLPKMAGVPTTKPAADASQFADLSAKTGIAAKDLRAMAEAAVEASKGLRAQSLQDCIPITDEWLEDAGDTNLQTLMGYPIEFVDDFPSGLPQAAITLLPFSAYAKWKVVATLCPRCNVTLEYFGASHVVEGRNYWHCMTCRHSYRDEGGTLTDLGREAV